MLKVNSLEVYYDAIQVIWGASFQVAPGGITALVGSNGAGKTTILNTLAGLIGAVSGNILFESKDIGSYPAYQRVALGISLVPEGRRLFPYLSVRDNLDIGAYTKRARAQVARSREWVFQLFPKLAERGKQMAGSLSGGEQQMLAVGRSLMSRPKLLMLDEPSLGLAPTIVAQVYELIKKINDEGVTILLVEQNVQHALQICHQAFVLETGRITLQGSGKELLESDHVKKAYLGL
jgi:branched-chain amino acid transport system ATP-binding protein